MTGPAPKRPSGAHGAAGLLEVGAHAPEFSLFATPDQRISLRDFRGRPVVLVFYPADWSPVCSDQLALYNELLPEIQKYHGAEVLGISVDGVWCHLAFGKERKLRIPLLADFEPKGAVSRLYGAFQADAGESARALYVLDEKGFVRWRFLSPVGVNPGADGILAALEAMHPTAPSAPTSGP